VLLLPSFTALGGTVRLMQSYCLHGCPRSRRTIEEGNVQVCTTGLVEYWLFCRCTTC
jgi:hypothetical protein